MCYVKSQGCTTNKIALDIECADRVYLNRYVKNIRMAGGLNNFIREQMGFPIPSPMLLPPLSQAYRTVVYKFAEEQWLTIVNFAHEEETDETARALIWRSLKSAVAWH